MNAAKTAQQARRKQLYTLLRVANAYMAGKVPHWSDDDYRLLLKLYGAKLKSNRYSATTMSVAGLENALDYFKAAGFKPRAKQKPSTNWRSARIAKLNAMWCALADAGHVRNRSEKAMQTWCCNQVKELTALQWATSDQLNAAVEMLKKFQQRAGINQPPAHQ
jgi:hypothetical protein